MKTALKIVLWCMIVLTLGLVGFAVVTAGLITPEKPEMQELFDLSLNVIFYWGYALFALAIIGAIVAFLLNVITHPSGLLKTLIGVVVVVAIVGSLVGFVFNSEIAPIRNSAGGVFDNLFELRIAELGLYVTYTVAAIAVLVVIFDMCSGLVRRFIK